MSRSAVAAGLVAVLVGGLAGCGERDPLKVGDPSPASPAAAPAPTGTPAGKVWRLAGGDRPAEGIAVSGGRVAVGIDNPARLAVLDARTGRRLRTVELAAAPSHVVALPGGGFRVAAGRELVTLPAEGEPSRVRTPAAGHALAVLPDGGTAVTFPERGTVGLYDSKGEPRRSVRVGDRPEGVAAMRHRIGVVDAAATSLTSYRIGTGKREEELRAGNGALHVAAAGDRFVVVDTRDGELLVFSTGPLYLRQRYPVAGSPYGVAYDTRRQRLWVTLTGKNQLVGYDMSGGAPEEITRHPTVRQPNSVAVDPDSGTVYVAGRATGVVQAIPG